MNALKTFAAGILILVTSLNLSAQDMKEKKHENTNWHMVAYVKFNPGEKDAAVKIIEDYFAKADANAGINPPAFAMDMSTGDYDYIIAWKMTEGVESLNWEISPDDVKWFKEMGKLAGDGDKAMAKIQEFYSHVETWKTEIGRNMVQ